MAATVSNRTSLQTHELLLHKLSSVNVLAVQFPVLHSEYLILNVFV